MKNKNETNLSTFKNEVDFAREKDLEDVPPSTYFKYIDKLIVDRRDNEKFLCLIEFKIKKKILISFDEYSKLETLAQEAFVRMNLMKFYKEIGY